ncbi:uncharacterized protein LOC110952426 [Acanthochromis polyacanthus]|uniref:uncharacterized protein LOC110952426 n=1 Tax=Acanthochromis polyacanthus TaxID=80966 RepID=UPI000B901E30|nr:uncharacterized protein LOC110952426 [Acanthochromis polyacanthus]
MKTLLPDGENMVMLIEDSEDEAENDGKARDSAESKEEQDEVKTGEMKDEEVTEVADIHVDNVATDEVIQSIAAEFHKQIAQKKQLKVALKRIQLVVSPAEESHSCTPPQTRSDGQTSPMELPEEECLCEDEDAHSDKEDEHNSPAAAADSPAAPADSSQISDPLLTADVPGPSASPLIVQNEDPGETDVPSSGLDTAQSQGIKQETSSPQKPEASDYSPVKPSLHTGPYILETSTIKTSDYIQEEPSLHTGPYILETSTIKTSDDVQEAPTIKTCQEEPSLNAGPYIQEEPANHLPSGPSFDEDTIDVDQLKREKLKMQLKVLKLQEEYYTLKIMKLKE